MKTKRQDLRVPMDEQSTLPLSFGALSVLRASILLDKSILVYCTSFGSVRCVRWLLGFYISIGDAVVTKVVLRVLVMMGEKREEENGFA